MSTLLGGRAAPRAIATDCDGTLLRTGGTVSERTRRALDAAGEAGIEVVLVTARPPRWLDELADLGVHGVALCGNGAFTYDLVTREVVSHRLMDPALVTELLAEIREALPEVRVAVEGLEGFGREDDFQRPSGRRDGEWLVGDVATLGRHAAGKILVRHQEWDTEELYHRVAAVVGDRAETSHSGAVGLTEIVAPGVTKALAVAEWCAEHEPPIVADQVWTFGDAPNDLPMLSWSGRSFAVANAHPDVLAAASDRIPSNDEDGVAATIEALLAELA